ncbi:hypothetical protein GOZ97_07405 [Agrobacterium vitis]|uniref:hypothetical protein n=1 Tax=Agrobacterium vitis TaxID=373 RepID=UPI0008FB08A0|nr:hypothetical protein [Agrobacterium vitis]MUZ53025.1 hypothetical protein [Agrobacterium vitis]MUZ91244.1 hypothetical protein [Agrobacterium vitis]MVA40312.1 hypothetical protein [Agrobacterium vitis]NSX96158.1 hypothetical protein [Agrobacterium vitis]NSZ27297.1 hypothetical protein [Agrobacterium vitis]
MADVSDADAASTAAPTETFVPAVSFLGYPDGSTEVHFVAGVESAPVTAEFATLMRAKGLVADSKTTNEAAAD